MNLYDSGPIKFADFVSDKCDQIHEKLYEEALKEYYQENIEDYSDCSSFEEFVNEYKVIEIKGKEYMLPSSVILSEKKFPYRQKKIDLSPYWNKYQYAENNKDISDLMIDEDTVKDAKLVYVNYVTGRCKFRSRMTGKEFWTTIDYVNKDTEISDEMTLKDTFTYKIDNDDVVRETKMRLFDKYRMDE